MTKKLKTDQQEAIKKHENTLRRFCQSQFCPTTLNRPGRMYNSVRTISSNNTLKLIRQRKGAIYLYLDTSTRGSCFQDVDILRVLRRSNFPKIESSFAKARENGWVSCARVDKIPSENLRSCWGLLHVDSSLESSANEEMVIRRELVDKRW